MTIVVSPLSAPDQFAKILNGVRALREGRTREVYLSNPLTVAFLQELVGIDLGAAQLPEGELTEVDLEHYAAKHPKKK